MAYQASDDRMERGHSSMPPPAKRSQGHVAGPQSSGSTERLKAATAAAAERTLQPEPAYTAATRRRRRHHTY